MLPGGTAVIEKIAPAPAATNKKLRLFFFACGTEDPRMPALNKLEEDLRSRQINLTLKRYPGEQ
jgi:esterase/lipase superfamily enzyme